MSTLLLSESMRNRAFLGLVCGQRPPASRKARLMRRSDPEWGISMSRTEELQ